MEKCRKNHSFRTPSIHCGWLSRWSRCWAKVAKKKSALCLCAVPMKGAPGRRIPMCHCSNCMAAFTSHWPWRHAELRSLNRNKKEAWVFWVQVYSRFKIAGTVFLGELDAFSRVKPQVNLKSLQIKAIFTKHRNWLVVEPYPSEKYKLIGMIIPNIYGTIKHVPNHQPV